MSRLAAIENQCHKNLRKIHVNMIIHHHAGFETVCHPLVKLKIFGENINTKIYQVC